jgi:hypothetical protein
MVSQSNHFVFRASACPGATCPEDYVTAVIVRKARLKNSILAGQVWARDFEFLTEKTGFSVKGYVRCQDFSRSSLSVAR